MPQIEVKRIKKTFKGNIVAVDDVSLKIKDKEYVTLLGSSGSGKTTLLRLIAGLESPDSGQVYIDNQLINHVPPEKRDIGFVFQDFALFPHLSTWNNVTYSPQVKGLAPKEISRIGRQVLQIVGLYSRRDSFPHELSGGMKQRVGLARALASSSKILLMDEPLGSLDARIKRGLKAKLRKWVKELGLTAIHVAHSQQEAMQVSDRIFVMSRGKIIQSGEPEELYRRPQSIFVADFIGESNFLAGTIEAIQKDQSLVHFGKNLYLKSSQTNFKPKTKVVASFRPEEVRLYPKTPEESSLLGELIQKRFLQGRILFTLRLPGRQIIKVSLAPSSHNAVCKKGEKLVLKVSPQQVHLFPWPPHGLKKELQTLS
jgi:ABC-type Fe3+/spermidine/putrescine transport system ATPase subunit